MRVLPSGAELARLAREKLLEELLPLLPPEAHYAARMAANAMAIAARELGSDTGCEEEVSRLMTLLPEWKPAAAGDDAVREGARVLAGTIRSGRFDTGGPRKGLARHLQVTTEERLAVSNPKALK
jgi:hypothetical protein